jgi:branched-chain amino acid transport system ATP-binding protein
MQAPLQEILLQADNVSKHYGDFVALGEVSLDLCSGELVSIVGPNGAGKTTLVNVLTALHQPTKGKVKFAGQDIAGLDIVELSTRGLARAFQLVHIFPDLTVRETLSVAACSYLGLRWKMFGNVKRNSEVADVVGHIAQAFDLTSTLDTPSQSLSHGKRKLLDVASALALHPKVLILDEPTAGVSTADKHGIMETLLAAAQAIGVQSIMLVEHDMDLVSRYSSRIIAMQGGSKIADLPTDEFFANEEAVSIVIGKGATPCH